MNTKNPMSKALIRRETIAGYAFMAPSTPSKQFLEYCWI